MAAVTDPILQQYVILTKFLGRALGPDYEVALHDLTDTNRSVIAIANGHISGRKVGAPLTNMALGILRDRSYEYTDYRVHDYGLSINGKELRSNTLFIKRDGKLIGMLCINFDDSRYTELAGELLELAHPSAFLKESGRRSGAEVSGILPPRGVPERYSNSTEGVAADAISWELEKLGATHGRLTVEERLKVVAALEANGIFLLKGVVREVAEAFHCSQASVYRYLAQVKGEGAENDDG